MRKQTYPLRIETGNEVDYEVSANGTRITVGGVELRGVRSVDVSARPGDIWVARLEVVINPARDIVAADGE